MLNLNDIDKALLSEPVVQFLNLLETKHTKLTSTLNVKAVQSVSREEFWQLRFYDPRFTGEKHPPVGVVEWTYGSRSDKEYKITSRKITNERYGHWGSEHASRRTKDIKKAVKIALEALVPFEWIETIKQPLGQAERNHEQWIRQSATYGSALSNIGIASMVEELENLMAQGVTFKTEAFKKAISKIPDYHENQRRHAVKPKFSAVIDRGDMVVFIPAETPNTPQELPSLDVLSDSIKQSIALLKIMDKDSLIPEVGYRGGENTYFIYA